VQYCMRSVQETNSAGLLPHERKAKGSATEKKRMNYLVTLSLDLEKRATNSPRHERNRKEAHELYCDSTNL